MATLIGQEWGLVDIDLSQLLVDTMSYPCLHHVELAFHHSSVIQIILRIFPILQHTEKVATLETQSLSCTGTCN